MARGLGTWAEVRALSIPQIREGLAACDRRDANIALQQLDTIYSAVAPIAVGDKGMPAYKQCFNFLMRPFRAKPAQQLAAPDNGFQGLKKAARSAPLTPAEASFAAAARARLAAGK